MKNESKKFCVLLDITEKELQDTMTTMQESLRTFMSCCYKLERLGFAFKEDEVSESDTSKTD
nr:MAG TPA: hypothetical protein [Caudoviricetes sp.]